MIVALLALSVSGVTSACDTGQSAASVAAVAQASPSALAPASGTPRPAATPGPTPSPTAAPTPSPTPSPKPTPVPWTVYKSKLFKYSIKHPPDWIVTPGSSQRADLFDDYTTHFVFINRDTVSTWVDIEGTVSAQKAFIKSHYKAKLLTDKRVSVGALSGRLLTFTGTTEGRKVYIQHLIIARGKVGYLLTMFSDRGAEKADAKLFLRMYNSFKPS